MRGLRVPGSDISGAHIQRVVLGGARILRQGLAAEQLEGAKRTRGRGAACLWPISNAEARSAARTVARLSGMVPSVLLRLVLFRRTLSEEA